MGSENPIGADNQQETKVTRSSSNRAGSLAPRPVERSNDSSLSADRISSHGEGEDARTPEPHKGEGVLSHGWETIHDERRLCVNDDEIQHLVDRQIDVNDGILCSNDLLGGSSAGILRDCTPGPSVRKRG